MIKYKIEENIVILDYEQKVSANEYTKTWSIFGLKIWTKHYKNSYDLETADDRIKIKNSSMGFKK